MKFFRDRQTMYPNHLDEVDVFDCLIILFAAIVSILVAWL